MSQWILYLLSVAVLSRLAVDQLEHLFWLLWQRGVDRDWFERELDDIDRWLWP